MMRPSKSFWFAIGMILAGLSAAKAATFPSTLTAVNASTANTAAVGGTPNPFFTTSSTSGPLWKFRDSYGFDVFGNNGIYEKDAAGNVGDAASLVTTISNLTAGQQYGVYVCYLSAANWQIQAGFSSTSLTLFDTTTPAGRVTNLGLSSEIVGGSASNRTQLLGFIGNATADQNGKILVYIDDSTANTDNNRTWYDGVAYGPPVTVSTPDDGLPAGARQLAADGAWTWFNDPRALFHNRKLYYGYVKSGTTKPALSVWDPQTNAATEMFEFDLAQLDDHNNPGIAELHDGRLLVLASRHTSEPLLHYRVSANASPTTAADWGTEKTLSGLPANVTYMNPYPLTAEGNRIYNFVRCIGWDPSFMTSDDDASTWSSTRQLINAGDSSVRPYKKETSNYRDRVDFIYTDAHPDNDPTSIYHLYYKSDPSGVPGAGALYKSDGTLLKTLDNVPLQHDSPYLERGSYVYQYSDAASTDPNAWIQTGRAWTWEITYQSNGAPVCVFQVKKDNATGTGWINGRIYYYYARWTGSAWQKRFIAQGGRSLYSGQVDYGGGMAIDPNNPNVIYISSNALNPFDLSSTSTVPLGANERYELYRGVTKDGGLTFTWTALTQNSSQDNLRPYVPRNHNYKTALIWFRGTYAAYTSFTTRVMGLFTPAASFADWATDYGQSAATAYTDEDGDGMKGMAEYVLGSDPASSSSKRELISDGSVYSFTVPSPRPDATIKIEQSKDMASWKDVAVATGGGLFTLSDTNFTLTQSAGFPLSVSVAPKTLTAKQFFRLEISP